MDDEKQLQALTKQCSTLEDKIKILTQQCKTKEQKINASSQKKLTKASFDLQKNKDLLESCRLAIKGIRYGVTSFIQEEIIDTVTTLLSLEADFRQLWMEVKTRRKEEDTSSLVILRFKAPVEFRGSQQNVFSIFHVAAVCHDIQLFEDMLRESLLNTLNVPWYALEKDQGNTPLHICISLCEKGILGFKEYEKLSLLMLKQKIPRDVLCSVNNNNMALLQCAISVGSLKMCKRLIEKKVDFNPEHLLLAFNKGHCDVAVWAFEMGQQKFDNDVFLDLLWKLLHVVVYVASIEEIPYTTYLKLMDILIANGVDINSYNSQGEIPLHVAAKNQSVDPICMVRRKFSIKAFKLIATYRICFEGGLIPH